MIRPTATFRFDDKGRDRLKAVLQDLGRLKTKVGYPSGGPSTSSIRRNAKGEAMPTPAAHIPVAALAAVHQYGSPARNIPPRPFMTNAWNLCSGELQYVQAGLISQVYRGARTPDEAIKTLGEYFTGQVKRSITEGPFEDLADSTILRKKSSVPLIDTGLMRASVTHVEVEE